MSDVIKIIEFQSKYTEEAKELARRVMIDLGLDLETVDLYMEDDFDFETISEVYKDRSRLWLALSGKEVVGMIGMEEQSKSNVRLRRMFVLPEFQGKSVGQRLFDTALQFAIDQGYELIQLDTDKIMKKAHSFYEKNGFKKEREEGDRIFYSRSL